MKINKLFGAALAVLLMVSAISAVAVADDVVDSINEALKYYKDGQ